MRLAGATRTGFFAEVPEAALRGSDAPQVGRLAALGIFS